MIILSFTPQTKAIQLTNLGTFTSSGLTNYNPAYVTVFDNETQQTIALYVYAYDTTIKIWRVSDAKLLDTVSVTLPMTPLWGYGIFRYVGAGSLDGFWIAALCSNDAATTITAYLRVWFYNFTDKTCTQLPSDRTSPIYSYSSSVVVNQVCDYLIAWGNPIWQNNYLYVAWSAHVRFWTGSAGNGWHTDYIVGMMQLSNTQHLGSFTRVYDTTMIGNTCIGYQPIATVTFPFTVPSVILAGNIWKQYGVNDPKFLYTSWDSSTGTFTAYTGSVYSYTAFTNILYRTINSRPMFKPIGNQYSVSSGKIYWYWDLGLAYTDISQTKMQSCMASAIINPFALQSPNVNTLYAVNGIVYNVDDRDPYSAITDSYFYHPNGYIFNVGYNSTQGITTVVVDLGLSGLDLDYNVYITGQNTFFKFLPSTNQVTLYIIATAIPTVYTTAIEAPSKPLAPEETAYPSYAITSVMSVILPFVFLFVPAIVLTALIGKMGFVAGLLIGGVILVISNLLPMWTVFLIGLGVIALMWSSMKRGEVE